MRTLLLLALFSVSAAAAEFAPNHVFVARSSSGAVEHDKNMNYYATRSSSGAGAVAFGPNGHLYVSCGVAGVEEVDANGIPVQYFLDSSLNYAAGLAFGPHGNLLVADFNNDYVVEFDESGNYVRVIGSGSSLDGAFGIAVGANGHILVSSENNNRIVEFDALGNEVRTFGSGYLAQPEAIAFGPLGYLYVGGVGNSRLSQIDPEDGTEANWIAAPNPRGIVAAPDGTLLVTDRDNGTVVTFAVDSWGGLTQEGFQFLSGTGTTGGIAISPFRLKVALNGTCESDFVSYSFKEKATLSVFPGAGIVLLDPKNLGLLGLPFVGHGSDAYCTGSPKRRLFQGFEVHGAPTRQGASSMFLKVYGKCDGVGFFVVSDAKGNFSRMWPDCVVQASISTIKKLN
ncbi:MAG: NHL repeat-containing protein [Planctomycetes bacterium]|nr:NHL repeat-containing protein [Planctomycetota bacterium]